MLHWDATQREQRVTGGSCRTFSAGRDSTDAKTIFLQLYVDRVHLCVFHQRDKFHWLYINTRSKLKSTAKKKNQLIWNSNTYEIWGLHKYCKSTTLYYNFLKFTFHTYLIKIRYLAISTGNAKCAFCTKFKCLQPFSISLLQTICIMYELEILMWRPHPWQDLSVNVNFGATGNAQSTSFTELPLLLPRDAARPGMDLQGWEWARWQRWGRVMCRFEGHQLFTVPSPASLGRNGCCMDLPELERTLPLKLAHDYAGICLSS